MESTNYGNPTCTKMVRDVAARTRDGDHIVAARRFRARGDSLGRRAGPADQIQVGGQTGPRADGGCRQVNRTAEAAGRAHLNRARAASFDIPATENLSGKNLSTGELRVTFNPFW